MPKKRNKTNKKLKKSRFISAFIFCFIAILGFEAFWFNHIIIELYQPANYQKFTTNYNFTSLILQILLAYCFTYLYAFIKAENKQANITIIGLIIGCILALNQINLYPILNVKISFICLIAVSSLIIGLITALIFKMIYQK